MQASLLSPFSACLGRTLTAPRLGEPSLQVWQNTSIEAKFSLLDRASNSDCANNKRHEALLSSGSDHMVDFHPPSVCLFRGRLWSRRFPLPPGSSCWASSPLITPSTALSRLSNRPSVRACQGRRDKFQLSSFSPLTRGNVPQLGYVCLSSSSALSLSLGLSCSRLCFGDTDLELDSAPEMLTWKCGPGCAVCCKPQWNASCLAA